MSVTIHQGDVFDVLPTLAPGSVDCCVTSPPYWLLRSYLPKDHPLKARELGSEPIPDAFVQRMVAVFRLVRDALADHATCWLNIGDSYSQYNANRGDSVGTLEGRRNTAHPEHRTGLMAPGIPAGNLCLIPQRLALALQADGWFVRSVVVWAKPSPMPASLSGWQWRRCRVKTASKDTSHMRDGRSPNGNPMRPHSGETMRTSTQWADCPGCAKCEPHGGYVLRRGSWRPTSSWEPILMLAKSPKYFADGEAVRTPAAAATVARDLYTRVIDDPDEQFAVRHDHETACVSGANLRDVWTIAAEPLKARHYAAYPSELVYRCLAAGTSARGYCPTCSAPWCRVVDAAFRPTQDPANTKSGRKGLDGSNGQGDWPRGVTETTTIDWRPTCQCPPHDPRPALVCDPFCGSGRTGAEALRLGLDFVGIDLNPEYVALATGILKEQSPLFA